MGGITMKRLASIFLVLAALCSPVWAQNTIIQNGDSGLSARNKLNSLIGLQFNVRQPPYNAAGNGVTDDTTAIQTAIVDACHAFGGTVYFPVGTYKTTAPLTFPFNDCTPGGTPGGGFVRLVGLNERASIIQGNFIGYVIDRPDDQAGYPSLYGIEQLQVNNGLKDFAAGAIRWNSADAGVYIRNCIISGYTGLEMAYNTFTGSVSNCQFTPPDQNAVNGTVAIYSGQIAIRDTKITGYGTGIVARGTGLVLEGGAIETSSIGLDLGRDRPNVFRGTISGTTLTITQWVAGPGIRQGFNFQLSGLNCAPCVTAGFPIITVTPCGVNIYCQSTGSYTLNASVSGVTSTQTLLTNPIGDSLQGATINSFQTERNNDGIHISNASQIGIRNSTITGSTGGPPLQVTNAVWSAPNNGTIVYTLYGGGVSYAATACKFNTDLGGSWNPAPYQVGSGSFVNCTTSGNTITVTGAANSITIGNPGPFVSAGQMTPLQNLCIQFNTGSQITIESLNCGINGVHSFDFGVGSLTDVTFTGVFVSGGLPIIQPVSASKAAIQIINSFTMPAISMNITDLPGAGNTTNPPVEGMEYNIVNGTGGNCGDGTCTTFGTNVNSVGGAGALHLRVRWNAGLGVWTLMGR